MVEIILRQRQEERRKWREQRKKREEYDLKDLIVVR